MASSTETAQSVCILLQQQSVCMTDLDLQASPNLGLPNTAELAPWVPKLYMGPRNYLIDIQPK
jgi:hypothetical protein